MKKLIRNIVLIILFFYIGIIVGYVIIGDGNVIDALNFKAIKHIKDIILK